MIGISMIFVTMACFCGIFALKTNSFRFSGLSEGIDSIIADVAGGSIIVIDHTAAAVLTVAIGMIDVISDVTGNGMQLWRNRKSGSA